jgi:hypothetical protein
MQIITWPDPVLEQVVDRAQVQVLGLMCWKARSRFARSLDGHRGGRVEGSSRDKGAYDADLSVSASASMLSWSRRQEVWPSLMATGRRQKASTGLMFSARATRAGCSSTGRNVIQCLTNRSAVIDAR